MSTEPHKQNLAVRDRLVGKSKALDDIRSLSRKVAPTRISVLISGESGTGKEVVARLIHDLSTRRDENFVPVNCGAIPEGLFESEMFGHERGSFTGAERQRKGYFEQANNGTIFLDEVGEMPLDMQVKVLRVLESGEYFRVGGTKPLRTDVRVLAATNRDLREEVNKGKFREDLYFRIKGIEIIAPPLRDRPDDIAPLVELFADEFFRENHIERQRILPDAMHAIESSEWRGNVRELKHFIGTLLTLEREGPVDSEAVFRHLPRDTRSFPTLPVLAPRQPQGNFEMGYLVNEIIELKRDVQQIKEMLAQVLFMGQYPSALPERASYMTVDGDPPPRPTLDEIEKDQIRMTLEEYSGNRRKAATALGIGERTLYRKIKEYNL